MSDLCSAATQPCLKEPLRAAPSDDVRILLEGADLKQLRVKVPGCRHSGPDGRRATLIAALQAQLPLGLGSKGTVYVPPATTPEAQASAEAKAAGKPVEVVADRDEHNSVWANPDGTFTAQDWIDIQHVKQGTSWVNVNTNLTANSGVLQPAATKDQLTLSDGGSTQAATLSDGTYTIGLPFAGSLPTPTVSGNTATYANVLPGVDFVQSATTSGVEQSLVIKQRPTAALPVWKVPLKLSGLHAVADQGGSVSLLDTANKTVLSSGPAVMTDATGLRTQQLNPDPPSRFALSGS